MPARDSIHNIVRNALIKDGWTITHDPLRIPTGETAVYIDLGAEQWLGAERGTERLAVEIKSFSGRSAVYDLEQAVGQYLIYQAVLYKKASDRVVYLALSRSTYEIFFEQEPDLCVLDFYPLNIIVINETEEEIEEWIRNSGIDN